MTEFFSHIQEKKQKSQEYYQNNKKNASDFLKHNSFL